MGVAGDGARGVDRERNEMIARRQKVQRDRKKALAIAEALEVERRAVQQAELKRECMERNPSWFGNEAA